MVVVIEAIMFVIIVNGSANSNSSNDSGNSTNDSSKNSMSDITNSSHDVSKNSTASGSCNSIIRHMPLALVLVVPTLLVFLGC